MTKTFELPELKCERCKHTWIPRKKTVLTCPNCNSKYWYTPHFSKRQVAANDNE